MSYEILPFQWEVIHQDEWGETSRAKVYGGWIVRYETHIVFISDPRHQWKTE